MNDNFRFDKCEETNQCYYEENIDGEWKIVEETRADSPAESIAKLDELLRGRNESK